MKRTANICKLAVFLGFVAVFFALRLVFPSREFSEQENRYLQQRPTFSFASLFSGDFTTRFESYCTDQFPFRDAWTTVKARCELLSGKRENNGVYYCGEDVLIPRYDAPDADFLAENVGFVNYLATKIDTTVYFALIPGAVEVQSDRLPNHAPNGSQRAVIDAAYAASTVENIELLTPLAEHSDEYIFYRTDHHWTSLGAFYGYNALRDAWGLPVKSLGYYHREIVSDGFFGTSYSSSGFSWVGPDSMEVFVPDNGSVTVTSYSSGEGESIPLYDVSKLEIKDKYSFFLGGNAPRIIVETGSTEKPKLCLIRDSYADSLLPFLLEDFSEIDLIDLRYFKSSVSDYIDAGDFDMVLVMYSVANFSTDENLFMLGM